MDADTAGVGSRCRSRQSWKCACYFGGTRWRVCCFGVGVHRHEVCRRVLSHLPSPSGGPKITSKSQHVRAEVSARAGFVCACTANLSLITFSALRHTACGIVDALESQQDGDGENAAASDGRTADEYSRTARAPRCHIPRRRRGLAVVVTSLSAAAGSFTVFGPRAYTRQSGTPVIVRDTFAVRNPAVPYQIRIRVDGVADQRLMNVPRRRHDGSVFERTSFLP